MRCRFVNFLLLPILASFVPFFEAKNVDGRRRRRHVCCMAGAVCNAPEGWQGYIRMYVGRKVLISAVEINQRDGRQAAKGFVCLSVSWLALLGSMKEKYGVDDRRERE
jgi:hypothetical protein